MGDVEVGGNGSVLWRVLHESPESPNPGAFAGLDNVSESDHGKHRGHDGYFLVTLDFGNDADMQETLDSIRSQGRKVTMRVKYVREKHDQIRINW